MALSPDYRAYPGVGRAADSAAVIDAGLRAYMLRVYNWMTSGLVLTGIVAYGIVSVPAIYEMFYPAACAMCRACWPMWRCSRRWPSCWC